MRITLSAVASVLLAVAGPSIAQTEVHVCPNADSDPVKEHCTRVTIRGSKDNMVRDAIAASERHRVRAEGGDPKAQYEYAGDLQNGMTKSGSVSDQSAAIIWYRRSAEAGYEPAQEQLGLMLANGIGAPRNVEEAYFWLSLSNMKRSIRNNVNDDAMSKIRKQLPPATIERIESQARDRFRAGQR